MRNRVAASFVLALVQATALAAGLKLHVPSPDWRDQVIYFVVTDRFADGNPRNNDQGAGEFKPGDGTRWQGGDLQGLAQRLDYIQGLGATALWITPPVAQQWMDPSGSYSGYHGYWAEHFKWVDRHLGTLADYQRLSDRLHRRGMYLVQDIVLNHTGNFFTYRDAWREGDPAHGYEPHDRTPPVPRPSQAPFNLNDPRDARQREAAIYHWTPDVRDYNDARQLFNYQMSGLDDLNSENPRVRRALRDSYGYWIRQVGVDAMRLDTAFYVPPESLTDFMQSRDPLAPGVARVAAATGRRAFHVFGEGFAVDRAFEDDKDRKIESYVRGPAGEPRLTGMLNFSLYGALGDVFARGRPPAELADRIERMMKLHSRPHWMVNFVDNHDVDRFLAGGSEAGLRQALLAMFTLPGIPAVYYGTEQGFTEPRPAMFAAGWGSGGRDRYDSAAPLYQALAGLAAMRKGDRVFSRGVPTVLVANASRPGPLAWRMDAPAERVAGAAAKRVAGALAPRPAPALVALNSAPHEALLDIADSGWAPGTVLRPVAAFGAAAMAAADLAPAARVGAGGRLALRMPAHAAWVWKVDTSRRGAAAPKPPALASTPIVLTLGAAGGQGQGQLAQVEGDFVVQGMAPPGAGPLWLVVDDDLAAAQRLSVGADGRWRAEVDTARMIEPGVRHRARVWLDSALSTTPAELAFQVQRRWTLGVDQPDPAGDDHGPDGRYQYPTDAGWGAHHQLDIRRVRALTSGGALRLEVGMNELTSGWNPVNGFDRVAFTVFIELPGREGGARVMPLQGGDLPGGMKWHVRLRVHGWSNALFTWQDASATHEGRVSAPAAALEVDRANATIALVLPPAALGGLKSLSGARIYVTTWDYDGGYRALAPQAQGFVFGGGEATGLKVMDDSGVITLP